MKNQKFLNPAKYFLAAMLLFSSTGTAAATSLSEIETAILKEDYSKAENLANEYLAQNPSAPDKNQVLYFGGLSQLYQKDFGRARATFEMILAAKPETHLADKVEVGIIDSIYVSGDYKQVLTRAQDLLDRRPDSEFISLIYLKMARANLKLSNWTEAKKYLNKIVDDCPNSVEFYTAKQLLEEKQYFAVQVGAFLERARAEKLAQELQKRGEYAYIVETLDKDKHKFYRVRIGQFAELENAESMEQKLSSLGYPTRIYP